MAAVTQLRLSGLGCAQIRSRSQSAHPSSSVSASRAGPLRVRSEIEATSAAAEPKKKPSPLEKGGTLAGKEAAGKDPAPSTLGAAPKLAVIEGKFSDPRWVNGTWELAQFSKDGKVDWDAVIDAEVVRRQWLEEHPQSSSNDDKVLFDTSTIPWWAWVRRFHLPEAEKLNGRAAMVGFVMAYVVDAATGVGLVDQMDGFFGKLLLLVSVAGVLLVRRNEDVTVLKTLVEESTFYDKQWQAAWKEGPPRGDSEEEKKP